MLSKIPLVLASKQSLRKVLLYIAKEEETHVGEFQALPLLEDIEQDHELGEGKEEVDEILEDKD